MTKLRLPDLILEDHTFEVPLDHDDPGGAKLRVYARSVTTPEKEGEDLPWLVFLQGGPGCASPRPGRNTGWIKRATAEFRVLLLDQRGTGRSSPQTRTTLARFTDSSDAAEHLAHYRADAIVRDCEWIRRELCGADTRWTVLGQSFGGFCLTHYLSSAPEGLELGLFTGGLPKLDSHADDVYRETYPLCLRKNELYHERYPHDVAVMREIVEHVESHDARLPNGDRLTPRRFQLLGLNLGMSDGHELLHFLFEDAFCDGRDGPELSDVFLRGFQNALHFDTTPLFAALHELCYAQGAATNWSAHRVRAEFPQFDEASRDPLLLTGEMIYPWMFEEVSELAPLRDAAMRLAERDGWPTLYDPETLARNEVPCAAAIYAEDMYVPAGFSRETAARIPGIATWVTPDYEHNGLRADGEVLLDRLLAMARG